MNNKMKTLVIAALVVGSVGLAGSYVTQAYADEDSVAHDFVTAVADKLGIEAEVLQGAMDEVRDEQQTERLAEAVADGDLTQEQAGLLERIQDYRMENRGDMEEMREQMQDLTEEERESAREEHKQEMVQDLADALGEDVETIEETLEAAKGTMPFGGMKGGRGMRGPGRGMI